MSKHISQLTRKKLSICITAALCGFMGVSSAVAQQAANVEQKDKQTTSSAKSSQKDTEMETIVVAGTRADLQQAVEIKRNADTMVDAISASDIGAMPDQNIADSLQRVPGVQIQRNRGVAESVSIRGLPSNFTKNLVNGRPVTTAMQDSMSNRDFQIYILPSLFSSSLEVHKTGKANVEGGVAGTVNIITQRAFSLGEQKAMLSATANWDANSDGPGTDIAGVYSNLFLDDTLGFFVGVNLVDEDQGTHRSRGGRYRRLYNEKPNQQLNNNGTTDDKGIVVRDSVIIENYEQQRKRESLLTNLEWRPNDDFSWFNEVLYSQDHSVSPRESLTFVFRGTDSVAESQRSTFIGDQEYNSVYHSLKSNVSTQNEVQDRDRSLLTAQSVAKFFENDDFSFKVGLSHTESEQFQKRFRATSKLRDKIEAKFDMSSPHEPTGITLYGDAQEKLLDPELWTTGGFTSGSTGTNIEHHMQQTDLRFDFNYYLDGSFINSIDFGVSYADSKMSSIRDRFNTSGKELAAAGLGEFPFYKVESANGDFLDSSNKPQPSGWMQVDIFAMLAASGGEQAYIDADTSATKCVNCEADRFDLDEIFTTAYFQLNFSGLDDNFSGNIGVRYVNTDETVSGFTQDISAGFYRAPSESGKLIPKVPGTTIIRERSYDDVLPSLNTRYILDDDHVFRFAASQAMTRPSLTNLQVNVTGLNGGEDEEGNENYSMKYNDPALEPYRSNNFDLGYSWYFGNKDLFSTAFFYKDFESLIGDKIIYENYEVTNLDTGVTEQQEFKVTTKSNMDGVVLKGVEVTLQKAFTELPGDRKSTRLNSSH